MLILFAKFSMGYVLFKGLHSFQTLEYLRCKYDIQGHQISEPDFGLQEFLQNRNMINIPCALYNSIL